jgi:poly-gamma-glutamate capsule biosynthesis protein CapA/YwtB (metallophosphatase superfamily)
VLSISVDLRSRDGVTEVDADAAALYGLAPRGDLATPQLTSRRVRRNRLLWAMNLLLLVFLIAWYLVSGGGRIHHTASDVVHSAPIVPPAPIPNLDPDWDGDGQPVTLAFGGDVHFPAGANLGRRLAEDPATALGPTVPALLSGANLSMVNLESALTDGNCPEPQPKQYVYDAPASAITAFQHAQVSLITESNNHGEDCGPGGLQMAIQARSQSGYPILGIGQNVSQAFTPYRATINGEKIVIIAATQVIDAGLQEAWTATASQPGLASAYDVGALVAAVEAARREADTVVVYLHWGTEQQSCPNPLQEPLAQLLVQAGADIVVGTHAHVLLGGGYLGAAYVDYGLGNFAFYDNNPPENESGSLLITVTGRRIDQVNWRPAVIEDDLPQPLSGEAATRALTAWNQARACTDVTSAPGQSIASPTTETAPPTPAEEQELSQDND